MVQQLADNIAPQCVGCFTPEVTVAAIDVKPGSTDCINRKAKGVVPVAILGSARFEVKSVRTDGSLALGSLAVRTRNGPQRSASDVNADGYPDLVCNFDNASANWTAGQSSATVTGRLYNGLPFQGTDTVCVK